MRIDDAIETIEVPAIADLNGFLCEARVRQEVRTLAEVLSDVDRTVDVSRTVVLTGARGCGKTTAMNYLVSRIVPGTSEAIYANALVYRAGQFARVVVEAIATGNLAEKEQRMSRVPLLCVDGAEVLVNKSETTEVLRGVLVLRQENRLPTILTFTTDMSPPREPNHPWSRILRCSLEIALPVPSYSIRREIVRRRASVSDTAFSVRTEHLIADLIHTDMHVLNAAVDRLVIRKAFHVDEIPEEVILQMVRASLG